MLIVLTIAVINWSVIGMVVGLRKLSQYQDFFEDEETDLTFQDLFKMLGVTIICGPLFWLIVVGLLLK